jgi:mRNA-degrading endonuclease YafQ of YafQ-DinJ toxin-antitoxin module
VYSDRYTREFQRSIKKVDRGKLEQAIDEILADPYNARGSHRLKHDWSGYRAADFEGPDRIIFRVCEECIRLNELALHPLDCCDEEDRDGARITFVDFGDYHSGKRRSLRRKLYTFGS